MSRFGLKVSADQVVVCSGGQHAMEVALKALTRPGDTVLTESLTYPGMKTLASQLHLRLQGVAMDEQGIIPEALEAAGRGGADDAFDSLALECTGCPNRTPVRARMTGAFAFCCRCRWTAHTIISCPRT